MVLVVMVGVVVESGGLSGCGGRELLVVMSTLLLLLLLVLLLVRISLHPSMVRIGRL